MRASSHGWLTLPCPNNLQQSPNAMSNRTDCEVESADQQAILTAVKELTASIRELVSKLSRKDMGESFFDREHEGPDIGDRREARERRERERSIERMEALAEQHIRSRERGTGELYLSVARIARANEPPAREIDLCEQDIRNRDWDRCVERMNRW